MEYIYFSVIINLIEVENDPKYINTYLPMKKNFIKCTCSYLKINKCDINFI